MVASTKFMWKEPALGSVGQYQMSGIPFVTASFPMPEVTALHDASIALGEMVTIEFPNVTRWITVVNEATGSEKPLRFGFSSQGVYGEMNTTPKDKNYFVLNNAESFTGEWRASKLFLIAAGGPVNMVGFPVSATTASVMAGLTGIPGEKNLPRNWSGSLGVG
jgi:hypothetical protein